MKLSWLGCLAAQVGDLAADVFDVGLGAQANLFALDEVLLHCLDVFVEGADQVGVEVVVRNLRRLLLRNSDRKPPGALTRLRPFGGWLSARRLRWLTPP